MRVFAIALAAGLAIASVGSVEAARMPSSGPDPSWSDNQKFEWYLGYMSKAAAICRSYGASNSLGEIAKLSPYGQIGLKGISADGFTGAACGKIRNRTKELLQKKETYIRYMKATYDCSGDTCVER